MSPNFFKNNSNSFPNYYFFIISFIVGIVCVRFFFIKDYNQLLNQVKETLTSFSQQKENQVSQFLADNGSSLQFSPSQNLIDTIYINNNKGQELPMDYLRKILYVDQQQTLRLNAYLVNDKGALLTAQKEFDTSTERSNTKIIRNELLSKCLNSDNSQKNFYTGVDEGDRSVFGTYQKVSNSLPLCLFSETEKVTNIDMPAQQMLEQYIFLGLFFVLVVTFLGRFFSSFSSSFSPEEIISFIFCGAAAISYYFLITLVIRGTNYFSWSTHLLELGMTILSFSFLIIVFPLNKGRYLKIGAFLLGIYFLSTIFFEEYRQAYTLSSVWRNLILVIIRIFSIGGFLSLFFSFKKNIKL
jgi:hypothetical protein